MRVTNLEEQAALKSELQMLRRYIVAVEKELRRCQSWVGHKPAPEPPPSA